MCNDEKYFHSELWKSKKRLSWSFIYFPSISLLTLQQYNSLDFSYFSLFFKHKNQSPLHLPFTIHNYIENSLAPTPLRLKKSKTHKNTVLEKQTQTKIKRGIVIACCFFLLLGYRFVFLCYISFSSFLSFIIILFSII